MTRILECSSGGIEQRSTDLEGRTPADYGKLAATNDKVFDEIVASYWEDAELRVGAPKIDVDAIADENRRKGQPSGGWLSY